MSSIIDDITIELLHPENGEWPLKWLFYLVYKLRYKYFRFVGRHLEFLDSPCVRYNEL